MPIGRVAASKTLICRSEEADCRANIIYDAKLPSNTLGTSSVNLKLNL